MSISSTSILQIQNRFTSLEGPTLPLSIPKMAPHREQQQTQSGPIVSSLRTAASHENSIHEAAPENKAAENVPFYTPAQVPAPGTALDTQLSGKPIPKLFTPIKIRGVTMQNRIWVSPMCQYSAHEGFHTPWHVAHYGSLAQRGVSDL
jgi:hypothetical protein